MKNKRYLFVFAILSILYPCGGEAPVGGGAAPVSGGVVPVDGRVVPATGEPQIKSDRVEFRRKEKIIFFDGNVRVTREDNIILADRAVKDEKNKVIQLSGNIRGFMVNVSTTAGQSGELRVFAQQGTWDMSLDSVELWGEPKAVYAGGETGEVTVESERIFAENNFDTFIFHRNVFLTYKNSEGKSQSARYVPSSKMISLTTADNVLPELIHTGENRMKFIAENISLWTDTRRVLCVGKVKACNRLN